MIRGLVEKGSFQSALRQLETVDSPSVTQNLLMFEINRELGRYDLAWQILGEVQARNPLGDELLATMVEKVYLLYRENKLSSALLIIEQIRQRFPSMDDLNKDLGQIAYVKSYSLAGNLAWRMGKFEHMKDNYERALELSQVIDHTYSLAHALIGLGNLAKVQGDYLTSISYYQTVMYTAIGSNNQKFEAYAHNNLGEIYRSLGRIEEAIIEFNLANQYFSNQLSLGPLTVTIFNLGICYYILEDYISAMNYFSYALQMAKETNYIYQIWDIIIPLLIIQSKNDNPDALSQIYQELLAMFRDEADELFEHIKLLLDGIYHFSQKSLKHRVQAQEIFEQLAQESLDIEYKKVVLIFLIEIKIDEYIIYRQEQELDEIEALFTQLQDPKKFGPLFEIRIVMLEAKVHELRNNVTAAIELLRSALALSKSFGLDNQRFEIIDTIRYLTSKYEETQEPAVGQEDIDEEVMESYIDLLKKHLSNRMT